MENEKVDTNGALAQLFKTVIDAEDEDLVPHLQYVHTTESPAPLNVTIFKSILDKALEVDANKDAALTFLQNVPLDVSHWHFFMNRQDLFNTMVMSLLKEEKVFPRIVVDKHYCRLEIEAPLPPVPLRNTFKPAITFFKMAIQLGHERVRLTFTELPNGQTNDQYLQEFYREVDNILLEEGKCCFEKTAHRRERLQVVIWKTATHFFEGKCLVEPTYVAR